MKDKLIYVSQNNKNAKVIRYTTATLARDNPNACILNPKVVFSHLSYEEYIENSLTLLDMCDEMWVVGGMGNAANYELEYCRNYNIPVKTVRG